MQAKKEFWRLKGYRLPTEAEWEFACRAGTNTSRYFGDSESLLPKYAWFLNNGMNRVWPVASLKPNDFGLFDMQGNLWEWCYDAYDTYAENPNEVIDDAPKTQLINESDRRILRGGGFSTHPLNIRSAKRSSILPSFKYYVYGVRPVKTLSER